MIDHKKHTYVKIEPFANVLNEIDNTRMKEGGKSIIHPTIEPLIYKLSLAHPEWQFIGEDSWFDAQATHFRAKRFRIYEGADELGSVLVDTYKGESFEIRNRRISGSLTKRNYKSTKDVAKAIKIVGQFFGSKTMDERLREGAAAITSLASNKAWSATREFDAVWNKLAPALATYVTLNMDAIRPTLEAYGAPPSALDMLSEKNERSKAARYISNCRSKGVGTSVLLHGDRYVVVHDSDPDTHTILAASQLSDDMRGKLGILKIVDDEEIIESVGVKVNAATFYLVP